MSEGNGTPRYTTEQAAAYRAANADYPLFWHKEGGWAKKVKGRKFYFGKVEPGEALEKYHAEKDYLEKGELPPAYPLDAVRLRDLANEFLAERRTRVDSQELTSSTWNDYHRTCGRILRHLGAHRAACNVRPEDFVSLRAFLAKEVGVKSLARQIIQTRSLFKFGYESGMLDKPVRYGVGFKPPTTAILRKARAAAGPRDFSPAEVRRILEAAGSSQIRTMVLLAVGCGLGNGDCAALEIRHLDLEGGWLDFPRPKNGIARRAWLWPEIVEALREIIGDRTSGVVFRTAKQFNAWGYDDVSREFGKVLDRLGVSRSGRGFYGLRRAFRTIAAETGDEKAADLVMGHADMSMGGLYTQRIGDDRLRRVGEHVRKAVLQ